MTTITNEEAIAATTVIYHELKVLFKIIDSFDLEEDATRRKKILTDLKYLLQKGAKVDLTDKSIFNLFDGKP